MVNRTVITDEDGDIVAVDVTTAALQVALQNAIPTGTNVVGKIYNMGYDYDNTTWRDIRVDANGKIVVTI